MKIEAYYGNMKQAKETVTKLKQAGFEKTYVDMNDHYNEDRNVFTNLAGTESSVSLSGLVLESDSDGMGKAKGPLNAASPMVSGIGRFEEIKDVTCKIIADIGEGEAEQVKKLITEMGGDLESPNFKKPKLKDDREIAVYNALDETRDNLK